MDVILECKWAHKPLLWPGSELSLCVALTVNIAQRWSMNSEGKVCIALML